MLSKTGPSRSAPRRTDFAALAVLLALCLVLAVMPTGTASSGASPSAMAPELAAGIDDAKRLDGAPTRSCSTASGLCWTLPAKPPHAMSGPPADRPSLEPDSAAQHKWLGAPPDQPPRVVA